MKWLRLKRFLLAFACGSFLLQEGCPYEQVMFTNALAKAGSGLFAEIAKNSFKKWFDYGTGLI